MMKLLCVLTCIAIVIGMIDYRGLCVALILLGIQTLGHLIMSIKSMVS
ncbi:MAG: hypothetical protein SPL03_12800 [Succinivibrio dextrinosolvens]|nr:hypothetical protein [Succinivibrio dextrinosolvens]